MNPPDYYPVPDDVLEAAERAIIKYLASGNADSRKAEALTIMLMGGDWVEANDATSMFSDNGNMRTAFLYLLPSEEEDNEKEPHESHIYFMQLALDAFNLYLNEPS